MSKKFKTPLEEITYLRRYIHQNPELSFNEFNTQKFIHTYLKQFDFEICKIKTGIMVYVDLNKENIYAFRAEMDALPIKEFNDVSYKSQNNNMHACGHDGHMAILLMLCKFIYENKDKLNNNYLIIFQPSEECYGGAKLIVESSFFKKHLPKYVYTIHLYPTLKEGSIFYRVGSFLAMCVEIDIFIKGKSTHVSEVHNGIDSIKCGNQLLDELYEYFDNQDKNKTRFLVGKIQGGNARNIVSDNLNISITLRNFYKEDYLIQKQKIDDIVLKISKKFNTKIIIKFNDDFSPVNNDKEIIDRIKELYDIHLTTKKLIGDDFSKYQDYCRTAYFLLGVNSSFLHEPTFDFDEKVLLKGLDFYIHLLNL